jgi:hypothetical protein
LHRGPISGLNDPRPFSFLHIKVSFIQVKQRETTTVTKYKRQLFKTISELHDGNDNVRDGKLVVLTEER